MNYQLRRMKRKTVGIYITKEGEIEVRAPRSVSEAEIDRLVQEKEAWITTHQTKMRERIQLQAMDEFGPAGRLYFSAGVIRPSLRKQGIFPSMERAFCCPICRRQSCAPPLLTLPQSGKSPLQVRWSALPTRWKGPPAGAHSPRPKRAGAPARQKAGSIFPGASCALPPEAMDYVVVHELAHLIEFNHSSRFWAIVEGILPDYKARRQSLKEVQESLLRQDGKKDARNPQIDLLLMQWKERSG